MTKSRLLILGLIDPVGVRKTKRKEVHNVGQNESTSGAYAREGIAIRGVRSLRVKPEEPGP